jgi:hypothetical protein
MARADIERLADEDDGELPAGWESTVDIGLPERRQAIHIRLDPEVLPLVQGAWFWLSDTHQCGASGVFPGAAAGGTG